MSYYIGLELLGEGIKLLNVKKRGKHYHIQKSLYVALEEDIFFRGRIQSMRAFKEKLKEVGDKEKLRGHKIGILLPPTDVMRRNLHLPLFMQDQVKDYVYTNKSGLLPLPTDVFTLDYERCDEQPDKTGIRYQISGVEDAFVVPLTIGLAELGLHTLAITTIGDTLQLAMPSLKREGKYCVLFYSAAHWTIIFYEGNQCVYCHTIEPLAQEERHWAWEIFKVIHFTTPYEDKGEVKQLLYIKVSDEELGIIEEVSDLLGREIESITCPTIVEDVGLMGLIYQMSKGRKKK